MPKKDEKKLFKSHIALLNEKRVRIAEAMQLTQVKQAEFDGAINIVLEELGIPEEERGKWKITDTDVSQKAEKIKEIEKKEGGNEK